MTHKSRFRLHFRVSHRRDRTDVRCGHSDYQQVTWSGWEVDTASKRDDAVCVSLISIICRLELLPRPRHVCNSSRFAVLKLLHAVAPPYTFQTFT